MDLQPTRGESQLRLVCQTTVVGQIGDLSTAHVFILPNEYIARSR